MGFAFVYPAKITTFSNDLYLFDEADAKLLAVSTDSEHAYQAWIHNGLGHIDYPLGADKALLMAADCGILLEDQGVALRGLFIIDPNQTTRYGVIHNNNIDRSTQEVLWVLEAFQTGSLCGASWAIGGQPLKKGRPSLPDPFTSDKTVRIYTLPGCSYCRQVKEFLADNGISYEEIDLDSDMQGQAFVDSHGYTTPPVTVIGNHGISGFRPDGIKELLL